MRLFSKIIGLIAILPSLFADSVKYGLNFDENDRLKSHMIVVSSLCNTQQLSDFESALHTIIPLDKDLEQLIFGKEDVSGDCVAVRLIRGTSKDLVQFPLPEKIYRASSGKTADSWATAECSKCEAGFMNQGKDDADIYWLDGSKNLERKLSGPLNPGEKNTYWVTSYLGHQFVVVNKRTGEDMAAITVEYDGHYVVGEAPGPVRVSGDFLARLDDRVEATLDSEWRKSRQVTRTFTGLGFSKGRLPSDLWASISAYYYNNQRGMMREEWQDKGFFVNWWEVDARFIGMPWQLKKYWQKRLKLLVEQWSGTELELTDIYGMREYQEGARLLMHVDRINTHAASLIVNIAQHGMKQPWLLQIYDFADRLHEVNMEPGDIVYYESAKCLHGRMRPLNGTSYVNLFAHYRPMEGGKGDPQWYEKSNPLGTPLPIKDFGAVCTMDETRAGAFQSCGGEVATGGQDIFKFWAENAWIKPQS